MADENIMNCNGLTPENMEEACKLKQFQRLNFFNGMLMTASDFQLWQRNIEEKRHLINRLVLGTGLVCGLEVKKIEKKTEECYCDPSGEPTMVTDRWLVNLSGGVAIDCLGREIVVSKEIPYFVVEKPPIEQLIHSGQDFGLYIRRKDKLHHPIPSAANSSCCEEVCCYSQIEEDFELVFDKLIQAPRLAFDQLSYVPERNVVSFTLYLFEPYSEDHGDREILITSVRAQGTEQATLFLTRIPESDDLKVNIFTRKERIHMTAGRKLIAEHTSHTGDKYTRTADIKDRRKFNKKYEKKLLGEEYYRLLLQECSCCDDVKDPKVLLAVLGTHVNNETTIEVKDVPNVWYRDIVYNNKMLYDLISCHLVDLEKPAAIRSHVEYGFCEISERYFSPEYTSIKQGHTYILSNEIRYSKPAHPKIPAVILGVEYQRENISQVSNMENFPPAEIMMQITAGNQAARDNDIRHNQDMGIIRTLFFKAVNINSKNFRIAVINPRDPQSGQEYRGNLSATRIHWWAIFDSS
jgi:hypothetical protein